MKLAIYAITLNGAKQARRLAKHLPFAELFISAVGLELFDATPERVNPLSFPLSQALSERFADYDGHIFICATGIVSRVIAPLIQDKRHDPAVLCIDEQANFVIPLLSGHRGGANQLAERIAYVLKAQPVLTTASDVSETLAVDMLGAPFAWQLDPTCEASITRVSAAVVNQQPVAIVQQAGDKRWWTFEKRMPAHLICHSKLDDLSAADFHGAVLISDDLSPIVAGWQDKLVLWRPKSLVLGIGCDRNTPLAVIEAGLAQFSQQFHLSLDSVAGFASIDLKADESALLALSAKRQWPFVTYPAPQLDGLAGVENPSAYVKKITGSDSVAEAAALRQAQSEQLLVSKWVFTQQGYNLTLACCRLRFSEPLKQQQRKNWFGQARHGAEPKLNAHGNPVVEGCRCKPEHVDLNRPMLHHRQHIFLCEGSRCAKAGSQSLAHDLRAILKTMGLASGEQRIKISRSHCVGACRQRATMVIYQRHVDPASQANHALWLKNIEQFSEAQWKTLFQALAEDRPLRALFSVEHFAAVEDILERQSGVAAC
ncbi:cobalamin biosynthesis protein [Agarivorans sp. Z349TD_8]|uniref:cobalamin biosynthesis protein n=1 Tax=Agarivorans sp. Z349TD_8 TaxID=3421434 RepID=UPI003D7E3AC7